MDFEAMEQANEIKRLANEIEECLNDNDVPEPNLAAVGKIRRLCAEIISFDYYIGEKARYLRADVEIFFSSQKHERHGGAVEVKRRIKENLGKIRARANNLERQPEP